MVSSGNSLPVNGVREPDLSGPDGVSEGEPWQDAAPDFCERCGEEDISPNVEAYELFGECVCDHCAEGGS